MTEQEANDFRRTALRDFAFSTCLNCGTSLMCSPAPNMTELETDHRIKCQQNGGISAHLWSSPNPQQTPTFRNLEQLAEENRRPRFQFAPRTG